MQPAATLIRSSGSLGQLSQQNSLQHTSPYELCAECDRDGSKEIEFCHKWFKRVAGDIVEGRDFPQEFLFAELIIENVDFVDGFGLSTIWL